MFKVSRVERWRRFQRIYPCTLFRYRSRENWMIVAIITFVFSVVVLGFADFPRIVYRRLGVAFIQCVDDSVVITGDARRKIAYAAPSAFSDEKGEQRQTSSTAPPSSTDHDLALLKPYHVQLLP